MDAGLIAAAERHQYMQMVEACSSEHTTEYCLRRICKEYDGMPKDGLPEFAASYDNTFQGLSRQVLLFSNTPRDLIKERDLYCEGSIHDAGGAFVHMVKDVFSFFKSGVMHYLS